MDGYLGRNIFCLFLGKIEKKWAVLPVFPQRCVPGCSLLKGCFCGGGRRVMRARYEVAGESCWEKSVSRYMMGSYYT